MRAVFASIALGSSSRAVCSPVDLARRTVVAASMSSTLAGPPNVAAPTPSAVCAITVVVGVPRLAFRFSAKEYRPHLLSLFLSRNADVSIRYDELLRVIDGVLASSSAPAHRSSSSSFSSSSSSYVCFCFLEDHSFNSISFVGVFR